MWLGAQRNAILNIYLGGGAFQVKYFAKHKQKGGSQKVLIQGKLRLQYPLLFSFIEYYSIFNIIQNDECLIG